MVNWTALGAVLLFALLAGAVLVSAFSFGVINLDRYTLSRTEPGTTALSALIFAVLSFAVCVLGVLLGLKTLLHW